MKKSVALLLLLAVGAAFSQAQQDWQTYYEKSGFLRTPRYAETIEYCRRLDDASPWVRYTTFGVSPQGRDLPLVILSKEQAFTPERARATRKPVLLIQSGIHSGEIDGKDASLMLMREIAITKTLAHLLDNTILLIVPIFNVDGHERISPYNRINQNGPEEMGWRVTAQNLNLNRDYMKADTPEMRAMLNLFTKWNADFYVDCHVTDGIDCQYDITYAAETWQNIDPSVAAWMRDTLLPHALTRVENAGHKIFYYVFPREDNDLSKGLNAGPAPPRFSTGYAALRNRPAVLVETHMLKPYKARVSATYYFLIGMIEAINNNPALLREATTHADSRMTKGLVSHLPLTFRHTDKSVMREFLGIKARYEHSSVSGGTRRIYTGEPETMIVPFYEEVTATDSVAIPKAYLIPREWTSVLDVLKAHGIRMRQLTEERTISVQSYLFSNVAFRSRPYEGRFGVTSMKAEAITETRTYPKGSWVVHTDQPGGRVAVHLLEPKAPDSFLSWGFFNAIFEQKEYVESYVMEKVGAEMLAADAMLRQEFENRIKSDSTFARNPDARLNWLYNRSKWADPWLNKYPVGRVVSAESLRLVE